MNYRSKLEKKVAERIPEAEYEPYKMEYWMLRNYTPDFVLGNYIIEVKGFFRSGDISKYKAVRDQCEESGTEFIMLLQDPNKRVRKGSKTTMSGWCEKNNICWYTLDTIHHIK